MNKILQKRQELNNILNSIPENLKIEYLNYTIENGKLYGVPTKNNQIYKNTLIGIENPDLHELYLETRIEQLKLQNSLFGQGDQKLNKKIKNYELYLKRLNNAINKLKKVN